MPAALYFLTAETMKEDRCLMLIVFTAMSHSASFCCNSAAAESQGANRVHGNV